MYGVACDHGHPRFLENRRYHPGRAAVGTAHHTHDLVSFNELVRDGDRFLGLESVIINDQVDFFAMDAATVVDFFDTQFHRILGTHAVSRGRTGDGRKKTYLDGFLGP